MSRYRAPRIPAVGTRHERLIMVRVAGLGRQNETLLLCRCDCGRDVRLPASKFGVAKSCGCGRRDPRPARTHGHARKARPTPEYRAWRGMLGRCYLKRGKSYAGYGGRGITVCARWRESYEAFLADVGLRPSPRHQIDRRDNEGHYEPGNCRWATPTEQARNRRNTRLVEIDGERKSIAQLAQERGVPAYLLARRLRAGWSVDRAADPTRRGTNGREVRP